MKIRRIDLQVLLSFLFSTHFLNCQEFLFLFFEELSDDRGQPCRFEQGIAQNE